MQSTYAEHSRVRTQVWSPDAARVQISSGEKGEVHASHPWCCWGAQGWEEGPGNEAGCTAAAGRGPGSREAATAPE